MNSSGDAAEQVVRLSLEGAEVALKLTGSAAKHMAAALYAILKNKDANKLKGHQRLTAMLKSGKELKVFPIREKDVKQFAREARRYGVVYCALRGKGKSEDGIVDVMVRAEDAAKINRIVERFKLASVDTASIKSEIEKAKVEKSDSVQASKVTPLSLAQEEQLVDAMMDTLTQQEPHTNPTMATMEKSPLSEPTLSKQSKSAEGTAKKPSVRHELQDIKEQRQQETDSTKRKTHEKTVKTSTTQPAQHQQPKLRTTKKER